MKMKDIDSSNIAKISENFSKITSMKGVFDKIPEMISIQPINPFHKSISTEEALEEESDYKGERFKLDEHHCEICDSTLTDGAYILKNERRNLYFCSIKCINQFKDNGYNINDYELFEVSRCASFNCCQELGNLRRMCEKTKSLTNIDLVSNLSGVNFCEPAVAGQIQASYAIFKHLQKVDEENSKLAEENTKLNKRTQFLTIISTIMAVFTIVLTGISVAKSFTDKPIEYKEDLDNIRTILQSELNEINTIKEHNENIEELIRDLKNQLLKNKLQEKSEEK